MSKLMSNLGGRPGISAVLIDSTGTVLATPPDAASQVGKSIDDIPLLSAMADRALNSNKDEGSLTFGAVDGSPRTVSFARIGDTETRLLVSIDEDKITAAIKAEIRTAYLQLAFVCLFVLLGALIAAEKLIIRPIEMLADMATRFGQGDRSARRVRAAGARLQRDGGAARAARARAGRDQRPPHRHRFDRHALGPCQPPRLPEPPGF
jgi:hypothetical protein